MNEVEVIARVELRLALADTDAKFAHALDLFLAPLLMKLGSPNHEVVARAVATLQHILTRLSPDVHLPLAKLTDLLRQPVNPNSLRVRLQTLSFISKAFAYKQPGMSATVRDLACSLRVVVEAAQGEYAERAAALQFALFLDAAAQWADEEAPFEIALDSPTSAFLLQKLSQLFLLDLAFVDKPDECPGLAPGDFAWFRLCKFVSNCKTDAHKSESMFTSMKLQMIQFVKSVFAEEEQVLPLLIASGDKFASVRDMALAKIPQQCPKEIVPQLYSLALGRGVRKCGHRLFTAILKFLSRATARSPDPLDDTRLVLAALQTAEPAVQQAGLFYLRTIDLSRHEYQEVLPDLISALKQLQQEQLPPSRASRSDFVRLRCMLYEAIGETSRHLKNVDVVFYLFDCFDTEDSEMHPSIQEAFTNALTDFESFPESARQEALARLLEYVTGSHSDQVKFVALRMARSFALDNVAACRVCFSVLANSNLPSLRQEVRELLFSERAIATGKLPDFVEMCSHVDLDWPPNTLDVALCFLFSCLVYTVVPEKFKGGTAALASLVENDAKARQQVQTYLETTNKLGFLSNLALVVLKQGEMCECSAVWICLLSMCKEEQLEHICSYVPVFVDLVKTPLIDCAAKTLAILAPHFDYASIVGGLPPIVSSQILMVAALQSSDVDENLVASITAAALRNRDYDALRYLAIGRILTIDDTALTQLASSSDGGAMLAAAAVPLGSPAKALQVLLILLKSTPTNVDVLLANGEAVAMCCGQGHCSIVQQYTRNSKLKQPRPDPQLIERALESVLEGSRSTAPAVRRAAAIRLLCLVQFNNSLIPRSSTPQLQQCLLRLLTASDPVTQDASTKAMGILFDSMEPQLQQKLVAQLVASMTGDAHGLKVDSATKLFEAGQYNTEDSSVTTYKDVLDLASETGDSSLVYKFMAVAASSQLWESRRALAFGLESVAATKLKLSEDQLAKLLPRLYVYQFDPNTHVQQAMKRIWACVAPGPVATLDVYHGAIWDEALSSAGQRGWRVREAAALALAALVETLPTRKQRPPEEIWQPALRLLDDIKESVRVAASRLIKTLSASIIRRLEKDNLPVDELISLLLSTKGVHSDSADVQESSRLTLVAIANSSAPSVKKYRLLLINEFIALLSTMEPQAMNYLSLNAVSYQIDPNEVDKIRLLQMRRSSLWLSIESLTDRLDNGEMCDLIAQLPSTVLSVIGVSSMVGAARTVINVALRHPTGASVDVLVKACFGRLWDINLFVGQSYAMAIGYLCRQSSKSALWVVDKLSARFLGDSESGTEHAERSRKMVAYAVSSLSRHSGDTFGKIAASVLPTVFIGTFARDAEVADMFKKTWDANVGGESAVRLYAREILALAKAHLQAADFETRIACARAYGAACKAQSEPSDVAPLVEALQGRVYPGKELVFRALVADACASPVADVAPALSCVEREISRKAPAYLEAVLPAAGDFIARFADARLKTAYLDAVLAAAERSVRPNHATVVALLKGAAAAAAQSTDFPPQLAALSALALETWQGREALCETISALLPCFSAQVWARAGAACAGDADHEVVRLAYVRAAKDVVDHGMDTRARVREALLGEKSAAVVAEARRAGLLDGK